MATLIEKNMILNMIGCLNNNNNNNCIGIFNVDGGVSNLRKSINSLKIIWAINPGFKFMNSNDQLW